MNKISAFHWGSRAVPNNCINFLVCIFSVRKRHQSETKIRLELCNLIQNFAFFTRRNQQTNSTNEFQIETAIHPHFETQPQHSPSSILNLNQRQMSNVFSKEKSPAKSLFCTVFYVLFSFIYVGIVNECFFLFNFLSLTK